ncbi:hypothetical protein AB0L63_31465 [Nocardia sp. NPDC051990]|uniref:hypothetical protein n=1 Tax=Nocardia sp. NPDC051990 TaxID=3155285 RepID=UPI00343862AB
MAAALHLRHDDRTVGTHRLEPSTVTTPQRLAPVRETPLPTTGAHPPLFAVLGAHGGAGTSTLARWWAPAADTGLAWPASPRSTQYVVVAARMCMPGLTAAAERLREWHAGLAPDGVQVIGLVLTAARPGRVPAVVRRYRAVVAGLVEHVYEIDWHDELVTSELTELAQYLPYDPAPPRRSRLREAVPTDVHRAGTHIITHLAATRSIAAQQDSEISP